MYAIMNMDGFEIEAFTLSKLLQIVLNNSSIYKTGCINLENLQFVSGLFEIFTYCCQFNSKSGISSKSSYYELIIADKSDRNKKMAVLTADGIESELIEMDSSGIRENVIIDLNEEGRRWEGGELNGKPFGFGCEYSEDGNLVYEGFVFEGKKVCFGKEWNDDGNNNCLVYEGEYWNNERCGKGISYDLNGNVDYEGEWMNNHIVDEDKNIIQQNKLIVPITIEMFIIDNTMFNDKKIRSLYFSPLLVRLKRIEIGNKCFKSFREFVLDGLESLESVNIGEDCFRVGYLKRSDGLLRISNCPNICQLKIGQGSFRDYQSIELLNLSSMRTIKFEKKYFKHVRRFVIDGLEKLESVNIGERCFWMEKEENASGNCQITNCPNLRQIEIGNKSFRNYKSFEIANVNSLQSVVIGNSCFYYSDLSFKGE